MKTTKRNYSLALLLKSALVVMTGCAFFLPGSGQAQSPDVSGDYRGFSQSVRDPDIRGSVELNINFADPPTEFEGSITILGNTYRVTGRVDANGTFSFTSHTGLTGKGTWQDLTRGGALMLATYKLAFSADQGKIDVLRDFADPPDPDTPPDIAGLWPGTFESGLSLMRGAVEWSIQQDRTETGAPGTGFTGTETNTIIYDFVGTIDGEGNFVRIGLSADGMLIDSGQFHLADPPDPDFESHSVVNFADGQLDLIVTTLTSPN